MKTNKKEVLFPVLKRLLIIVTITVVFLMQSNIVFKNGVAPFLLLPLTVCISAFEKEFSGMLFGLLAGALWDMNASAPDGIYAILFSVLACLSGLLFHHILCVTLLSVAVVGATFTTVFVIFTAVFSSLPCNLVTLQRIFLQAYALPFVLTLVSIPLFYGILKIIEKRFQIKKLNR